MVAPAQSTLLAELHDDCALQVGVSLFWGLIVTCGSSFALRSFQGEGTDRGRALPPVGEQWL